MIGKIIFLTYFLEKKVFEKLQHDIANAMNNYMKKNDIGFNELVRRLD